MTSLNARVFLLGSMLFLADSVIGASPRVKAIYPSGGQRGTEVEVSFNADRLEDARDLLFDAPGFKAVEIIKPDEKNKNVRIKIAVPSDARLGEHPFRVVTDSGVSDLKLFYVSPFPMVEEAKAENKEDLPPQPVALGTTVYGRTPGEDEDTYEVEVKKDTRISAEVIAARLQTQQLFDTLVTIKKADGTRIAQSDDVAFSRQDPAVSVIAPEDGKYLISIRDSTNSAEGECHYLMNIGSFPRPLAVYPPGGPAGEEVTFTLLGDASGPIQRTVKLPDAPTEKFEIFTEDGQPAMQPNPVRVSPFPNILEVEPNNTIDVATVAGAEVPFALNGVIQEKGDVDCFKFTAKKDRDYELRVHARELRSPLDSVITIYNAKGGQLAGNDDSGGPDSYQRWKAPEDGEYFVQINDQLMRGGPNFTYRLEITTISPEVTAWLPEMVQNSNQERRAIVVPRGNRYATLVRVKRVDMGGDLVLTPEGLPDGIKVSAPPMDKSVDTIPMVFEAPADASLAAKAIGLKIEVVEPPKDGPAIQTRIFNEVNVAENGNQRSFYSVSEDSLPAAITEEIPVRINLTQPKVPILQNGAMVLKVSAERKNDFKGKIDLALLYSPPGIGNAGTVAIDEGESEGTVTISANDKAPVQKWKICVVGATDTGKGQVWLSSDLIELEVAEPFVGGKFERSYVDQGSEGTVTLKLESKREFEGKARIELQSLPAGVTAEPVEITKDDKQVTFQIKAAPDAQAGQHKQLIAKFFLTRDGEEMSNTIAGGGILRVDKASVAKN